MRRRPPRAAAWLVALAVGGCGEPSAKAAGAQQSSATSQPGPRTVDVAAIAPAQLIAAVLDECHRPLRGRMQRVTARVTIGGGAPEKVFAALPTPVRVQGSDGMFLLRDGVVRRIDASAKGARQATDAEATRVGALATLVDAAAFGPLHRAVDCRRTGATGFAVTTGEGTTWQLQLRADTLLPESLTHGAATVRFDDYLRTPTTWVVRAATSAELGSCEVVFEDAGTIWDEQFFAVPEPSAANDEGHHRIASPGSAVEARTEAPTLVSSKAMQWVVLEDPAPDDGAPADGEALAARWAARAASYTPVHEELRRQGQQIAGFPILFTEAGRRCLAVPFRRRPDGQALTAPAAWRVRDVPAGKWLVVHPPNGDFGVRSALGTALLTKALESRDLTARSPITSQPFLHLEEGVPPMDKLRAPTVRVAVLVE